MSTLGLVAALEIHAREVGQRGNLRIGLDLDPVELGDAGDITVYRLVQESLTNIVKYAQAAEVTIELRDLGDGRARVSVRDDGTGFDIDAAQTTPSHGLIGMRYRVEAVGGAMTIESRPGHGTTIAAVLPIAASTAPPEAPPAAA